MGFTCTTDQARSKASKEDETGNKENKGDDESVQMKREYVTAYAPTRS
jgi:hypothetical protein